MDYRIVKIMYSLEGGYTFEWLLLLVFQRCISLDAQYIGLAKDFTLKKL